MEDCGVSPEVAPAPENWIRDRKMKRLFNLCLITVTPILGVVAGYLLFR